jgi:uncharacterized protein YcfJ
MKRLISIIICSTLLLLTVGCQNTQTRATEGAVIGGVVGAGAGYGIGNASGHHGGEGAAIGAVAGAVLGGLLGGQMNKNKSSQESAGQTASSASQLSLQQIVDMSKQGVNEVVIIDKISLTNSKFTLTPADTEYLKQQGVSQKVIDAMLAAK